MKWFFRLIFLFFSVSFFAQSDYTILSIAPELLKNANSVVIDEVVDVDATNIRKTKITTRRVVAVLNKRGVEDARTYEFYSENSRVRKINAEIYDAFGNRKNRYKKKDFLDVSRSGGNNMYLDSRMVYLNYTPTDYPYIMVFESEVETGDSGLLNPWVPLNGYAESAQKSVYKIKFNPQNKPRYKGINLEGHDISISESPDELIFTADNLEAIRYEELSPGWSRIIPHIQIAFNTFQLKQVTGTSNNWEDFGNWMEQSLLADVRDLPNHTIERVKNLVANETTNEGKARIIYQFVQDKVRYVSIQIGIGGWKPMLASDVDRLSYGDCKALTNYTKALLDAVEVPSYYTVLYGSQTAWDMDEDFASMQGNHVILGIPDEDEITWLECTSQDLPYGYIGSFTDDRNVIMLTPEGGKLARTKIYESTESTQETNAMVRVDDQGKVKAEFISVSKGLQYENRYFLAKKKQDEVDQYYKNRWSYINGFSISNMDFINDREEISFTENLIVDIPNYANAVGNDYLFSPNIFNQNTFIPPRIENRKQKLTIGRGYTYVDTMEIEFPANYVIAALPEASILETQFGRYEINFVQTAQNKIIYSRNFRIEKGEYSASEYESFRDFMRTINRMDRTKILLKQDI